MYRFIYPFLISGFISLVTFPPGPGAFQAADVTTHHQASDKILVCTVLTAPVLQIEILFSNYSWARNLSEMTVDEYDHIKHWRDPVMSTVALPGSTQQ